MLRFDKAVLYTSSNFTNKITETLIVAARRSRKLMRKREQFNQIAQRRSEALREQSTSDAF